LELASASRHPVAPQPDMKRKEERDSEKAINKRWNKERRKTNKNRGTLDQTDNNNNNITWRVKRWWFNLSLVSSFKKKLNNTNNFSRKNKKQERTD
jgi:hypothetical protein